MMQNSWLVFFLKKKRRRRRKGYVVFFCSCELKNGRIIWEILFNSEFKKVLPALSTELISSQFPSFCNIFIKPIYVSQVKLVKSYHPRKFTPAINLFDLTINFSSHHDSRFHLHDFITWPQKGRLLNIVLLFFAGLLWQVD